MRASLDKYLPFLFWSAIVIVLTGGSWVVVTGREDVKPHELPQEIEQSDTINEVLSDRPVIYEVSADGSVNWTLYMETVESRNGGVMQLSKPRARYSFENGENLEITGDTGTYDENAGLLILTGGVVGEASEARFKFSVGEMTWDNPSATLRAKSGVEVWRDGVRFDGEELILNLAEQFATMEVRGDGAGVAITSSVDELPGDPE